MAFGPWTLSDLFERGAGFGKEIRATVMGGERSHNCTCAIPTSRFRLFNCITLDAVFLQLCFSLFSERTANFDFFLERPELIPISPRMIRVIKGMDLIMDVQVKGYPYPRSTWSHNGLLLPNASNFGSKTKLIIRKVTVLEGGLYSCYAKNPDGQDNLTFNVSVEGIDFICSKASFVRVDIAFQ